MARIKYVINERRLAYEGAVKIIAEGSEREALVESGTALLLEASLETEQTGIPEPSKVEDVPAIPHQTAAERAAAGLVQPDLVQK